MSDWKPDIFAYVDYRQYLRDYYDAAKANMPAFSYRYFARVADIASPSFLRHVMRGERNLEGAVDNFATGLGLDEEEHAFFALLVDFDQAEDADTKTAAFEKVAATRRFRQARRLETGMFDYLSHWYFPAIREMAARPDFSEDPAWIASQLVPQIELDQATDALATLLDLGMLERNGDGRIIRGEPTIATHHEVRSLAIANYHRQMLARAGESIERIPRPYRDLGAMTACVSVETIQELKARIHAFREVILELCDADDDHQVVIQFNSQLFPLSAFPEEEEPS